MNDNLVLLPTAVLPDGQRDEEVIDALRDLLEKAEAGHVNGIAYASVESGNVIVSHWAGAADGHSMTASVALLHHRFMATIERG